MRVGYRTGDMWAPKLVGTESLRIESEHFIDCIRSGDAPQSDGGFGVRVVELIEAATNSMRARGETVYLKRDPNDRRQATLPRRQHHSGHPAAGTE